MTKAKRKLYRRRAEETVRLYKFEDYTKSKKGFPYVLVCERTMPDLRDFAEKVWKKHGRTGWKLPEIKPWNGLCWHQKNRKFVGWSYSGTGVIKLAKRHRNKLVLLHELVHAMGYGTHGRGFVRKYGELLVEYGGLDEGYLAMSMGIFGIRLPAF